MSLCLSVILSIPAKVSGVFAFLYQIEWLGMVLGIPNLEGHQNCMICSKVIMILTKFFVHD